MRINRLLLHAASAAAVLASPAGAGPKAKRAGKFLFTGVNESGAEFGNKNLPGQLGKDYTWPVHSTIDTMMSQGFNIFRIPIMMERVVPTKMTGTVNETYWAGLQDIVTYITGKGGYAIVDPHNFGRYYGNIITDTAGFKAWWTTVATRFASNHLVIFDTNNEYHDMDNSLVGQLNQAAIDGIRGAGATTQYIFAEGNSYSGAWHWVDSGTGAVMVNLTDPSDKLIYEMHQYLDSDGSGTSATCVSGTIGAERIQTATQWLKQNNKKGVIGETGAGANAQCIQAVQGLLQALLDDSEVWTGWLWWGGGPWWGNYMYSMEPPSGAAYTGILPSIKQFVGA